MLYGIACEPLVGQYIESLNLCDGEHNVIGGGVGFHPSNEILSVVKKLVLASECFGNANIEESEWWEALLKEHEGDEEGLDTTLFTTVSLLAQLPNVKTLKLGSDWYRGMRRYAENEEDEKMLASELDAIVQCSNSRNHREKALGKLQCILPCERWDGYEERVGLQCLEPFMYLKSIKELYSVNCVAVDDGYTGIPFQWRFSKTNSPLTKIELTHGCMDAAGLSKLVSHTPCLNIFRYSHETKWHGCQHDWNAGEFVEVLARHCGSNLTQLAITLDQLYGDIVNGASSFRSFSNLQCLEIDARIMYGPAVGSGEKQGLCKELPEGASPWSFEKVPRLGDMLPASIRDVQINTDFQKHDETALEALLDNFRAQRDMELKELTQVVVRQFRGDSARALVKGVGVKLSVYDQDGRHGAARAMMPAWKRDLEVWWQESLCRPGE